MNAPANRVVVVPGRAGVVAIPGGRAQVVVKPPSRPAVTVPLSQRAQVVTLFERRVSVVGVARQGPPGRDGAASPSETVLQSAGPLNAWHCITVDADGAAVYCDAADREHADQLIGISTMSANAAGVELRVISSGPVENPAWAWTPERALFVGLAGTLTQDSEVGEFSQCVGFAMTPTRIHIRIGGSMLRS